MIALTEVSLAILSGVISGGSLALLAVWLLAQGNPESGARALAYVVLAWAVTIVLTNLAIVRPTPLLIGGRDATSLLLAPFLAWFVARTLDSSKPAWRMATFLFIVSAIGAVAIAADPARFIAPFDPNVTQGFRPTTAAIATLLGPLPLFASVGAATIVFVRTAPTLGAVQDGRRLLLMAAGLSCFLASATAWFGIRLIPAIESALTIRGPLAVALDAIILAMNATFLIAIALHLHRAPMRREDRRILGFALYAPLGTATLAAIVVLSGGPRIDPVAFWRIIMVALIVLAVMRHQLFDGAIRFKRTAIATLTVFGGLAVALVAEGLVRFAGASALADPAAALFVGAVFAAGVVVPYTPGARRAARRAFRALVEPHDPSRAQHLEIYRAALETRAAGGASLDAAEPELVKLRAELDVDARDHDLLALFVERRGGASAPEFQPGARILDGTLQVEREIGRGASARVYEARDETGRVVAVKVQAPLLSAGGSAGARAVREAQILDGLRSANVLPVVEVADRPEAFYVVTERARGTLADRLAASPEGRLAPADALRVTRDVLAGLAAAHKAGVVHCDVKPANVLLAADGGALLADFDAASPAGARSATRGTPAWMAPEQFEGRVSPAADVHAVGALLYRMLAGRHYVNVDGLNADQMRLLVTRAEPSAPADWPADVRAFVSRCLAKDPAARFVDAEAALAALPTSWVTP